MTAYARLCLVAAGVMVIGVIPASAQGRCRLLCPPSVKLEPTLTFSTLFQPPRVQELPDGPPIRERRSRDFEVIVAVDIPSAHPRLGFTVEGIWTPFGNTSSNPFTGQSASDVGVERIRDNPVALEFEVNLKWLLTEATRGWVSSHFDIVDKFSPAERPGDRAVYTHKLNLELDTAVAVFNWLPDGRWARGLELEGSLDYVATGLPRAGDVINGERFLDAASRWSFSVVLVIPIAPF
jgi:hypothetical protein